MGRRPGPGVNEADVPPNLPALARAGTLALQGGEEVRRDQDFKYISDAAKMLRYSMKIKIV